MKTILIFAIATSFIIFVVYVFYGMNEHEDKVRFFSDSLAGYILHCIIPISFLYMIALGIRSFIEDRTTSKFYEIELSDGKIIKDSLIEKDSYFYNPKTKEKYYKEHLQYSREIENKK